MIKTLMDQHDQNIDEKPVGLNLLHAFCCRIDSLHIFSK